MSRSHQNRGKKAKLSPASSARALSGGIRIRRRSSACNSLRHLLLICRNRLLQLLGFGLLGRRRVPVVYDLRKQDEVKGEASAEAVQDKRVVDFLQRSKNARERTKEVVDNLNINAR